MEENEIKKIKRNEIIGDIANIAQKLIKDSSYNFSDQDILDIIKALIYEKIDSNSNLFPARDKTKEKIESVANEIFELAKKQKDAKKDNER